MINIMDQAWLTRYPCPQQVINDKGGKFLKQFAKSHENVYGIKKTLTTRNPQLTQY